MQHPILVTHHGRPRVVILSADEFRRLAEDGRLDEPRPDLPLDQPLESGLASLVANMAEGFVAFDASLRVQAYNSVALLNSMRPLDEMVGKEVDLAQFGERAAVLMARMKRVLRTGEADHFEMRGVDHAHRRYEVRLFPYRGGVAATFTQITELCDLREADEVRRAAAKALDALDALAQFRVSAMGFIEAPNRFFCRVMGFSETELASARLIDVVRPSERHDLAEAMNAVLQGKSSSYLGDVEFLLRHQGSANFKLALTPFDRNGTCVGLVAAAVRSA